MGEVSRPYRATKPVRQAPSPIKKDNWSQIQKKQKDETLFELSALHNRTSRGADKSIVAGAGWIPWLLTVAVAEAIPTTPAARKNVNQPHQGSPRGHLHSHGR
jgi:hypothetical protein